MNPFILKMHQRADDKEAFAATWFLCGVVFLLIAVGAAYLGGGWMAVGFIGAGFFMFFLMIRSLAAGFRYRRSAAIREEVERRMHVHAN